MSSPATMPNAIIQMPRPSIIMMGTSVANVRDQSPAHS